MCRGTQVPAPRARRHARMQARAGHGGLSFPTRSTKVDQAPALASAVLLRSGAPGRTSRHASQRSVGLGGRALTVASRCVRRPLRPPSPKRLVFFLKAAQLNEIRHSVHPLPNSYGRKRKCNCNCAHKEGRRLVPGSLKSEVGRVLDASTALVGRSLASRAVVGIWASQSSSRSSSSRSLPAITGTCR